MFQIKKRKKKAETSSIQAYLTNKNSSASQIVRPGAEVHQILLHHRKHVQNKRTKAIACSAGLKICTGINFINSNCI